MSVRHWPGAKEGSRSGRLWTRRGAMFMLLPGVLWPQAAQIKKRRKTVRIAEFDSSGKLIRFAELEPVEKTAEEWQKQLTPLQFQVTRKEGTELAFTGKYNKHHGDGLYLCVSCGTALFDSKTKFDSGTGWPSFWAPIAKENVKEVADNSLGMQRVEVECARCGAHLGHVFPDGPRPTGMRYCMNSASLDFAERGR